MLRPGAMQYIMVLEFHTRDVTWARVNILQYCQFQAFNSGKMPFIERKDF